MEGNKPIIKPAPKWVGWLGVLVAVGSVVVKGVSTGDWSEAPAAVGAILALFAHSATGSGGK